MSRLFPIIALGVTLCVVAGVKIVRSSRGLLMQEELRLNVDLNEPALQMLGLVAWFTGVQFIVLRFLPR